MEVKVMRSKYKKGRWNLLVKHLNSTCRHKSLLNTKFSSTAQAEAQRAALYKMKSILINLYYTRVRSWLRGKCCGKSNTHCIFIIFIFIFTFKFYYYYLVICPDKSALGFRKMLKGKVS